jgi:methyl-accepting chemotaxis protein
MTIKTRIFGLVGAFAVLAAAITGLSFQTMSDYKRIIETYRHASENAFRAERLNHYVTAAALEMRGIYMSRTPAQAQAAADRTEQSGAQLQAFLDDWKRQLRPGELPQFAAVYKNAGILAGGGRFIAGYTRQHGADAAYIVGNTPEHVAFRERMQADITAMVTRINENQAASQAALTRFEQVRAGQFLAIAVVGILLMLAASLWIAVRSIAAPLGEVRRSMVRISEGLYETPIPHSHKDGEIAELWGALDILKTRAIEAQRLAREQLEAEHRTRELVLD